MPTRIAQGRARLASDREGSDRSTASDAHMRQVRVHRDLIRIFGP
jgi:hypothetical protein